MAIFDLIFHRIKGLLQDFVLFQHEVQWPSDTFTFHCRRNNAVLLDTGTAYLLNVPRPVDSYPSG